MRTALRLAEVRGVILLAAAQHGVLVYSYAPREVKARVAGHGHAGKRQMQLMVRALLSMNETPEPSDAADALAVALCHVQTEQARRRFWAGGSGCIGETAQLGAAVGSLDCQTKFDRAAQRVAGCRASYRRVDRFAVTRTMKTSLLRIFLLIAAASIAASATLAVPAPSGAKLTFRACLQGKLTRIHRDHRAGRFRYRGV